MNLIKWIKRKWNNWYYHDLDDGISEEEFDEQDLEWQEEENQQQDDAFFADADQRTVFILECLGQMEEATGKAEQVKAEYDAVTGLLVDMEEIENLPKEIRVDIMNHAQKIDQLEKERRRLYNKTSKLSEQTLHIMERREEEIPSGIKKMKENEDYRKLVKSDLKKLDGQRNACQYRKKELITTMANCRGIALICGIALIICIVLLLVLQLEYQMDVRIGYLIAGGAGAITLTILYVRYLEAVSEQKRLAKTINKLISLHNTVKIRYINNTNLLGYLYQKFDVNSSEELEELWTIYMEEVGARQKDEKLKEELEYYYEKLIAVLKRYRIQDPEIWTHQAQALLDPREMVEVRHALIARRQKLRQQLEYNQDVAKGAKDKIEELRRRYPKYASEISAITSRYDVSSHML